MKDSEKNILRLHCKFLKSGHHDYIEWLEEQVIQLENRVSQLEDEADHLAAQ
jgi:hypothetical protein